MEKFIVKKQININAEPSAVWDALTNPEKTKEYFFNCEVFSDWKVGSSIIFKGKMLLIKKIEMRGEILAIEPGKLLKYNLVNDEGSDQESTSTITDKLVYNNAVTTLLITDDIGGGKGAEERYKKIRKGLG